MTAPEQDQPNPQPPAAGGPPAPTVGDPPSLDVIRAELDQDLLAQAGRASSLDQRLGIALATDGVLIGLRAGSPSWVDIVASSAATVSILFLTSAFWPRLALAVSPRTLREKYAQSPAGNTKLVLLDTRIAIFEAEEAQLQRKWRRARVGLIALVAAAVLAVLGAIIDIPGSGASHDSRTPTPSHSRAATTPVPASTGP